MQYNGKHLVGSLISFVQTPAYKSLLFQTIDLISPLPLVINIMDQICCADLTYMGQPRAL